VAACTGTNPEGWEAARNTTPHHFMGLSTALARLSGQPRGKK